MIRYTADVKAFFNFEVDAETPEQAAIAAQQFVAAVMSAVPETVEGYNTGMAALKGAPPCRIVPSHIHAAIDGELDIELSTVED